jgi:hypothetical protein
MILPFIFLDRFTYAAYVVQWAVLESPSVKVGHFILSLETRTTIKRACVRVLGMRHPAYEAPTFWCRCMFYGVSSTNVSTVKAK